MRISKLEALVIKKIDYGEADRILVVFSKEEGKKILNIKEIKKTRQREIISTDILSLSEFIVYEKYDINIVKDINFLNAFLKIREDFFKINIVFYILKFLDLFLHEGEAKEKLYIRTIKSIQHIEKETNKKIIYNLIAYYLIKIIHEEGLKFNIGNGFLFDIENSEIVENTETYFIKLSQIEKEALNYLNNIDIKALNKLILSDRENFKIINILEKYIEYHLNIKLNFKNFIREDLVIWKN